MATSGLGSYQLQNISVGKVSSVASSSDYLKKKYILNQVLIFLISCCNVGGELICKTFKEHVLTPLIALFFVIDRRADFDFLVNILPLQWHLAILWSLFSCFCFHQASDLEAFTISLIL